MSRPSSVLILFLASGIGLGGVACGSPRTDASLFEVPAGSTDTPREACAARDPHRVALFGDLHVHTALSNDAWNYDLEVRPRGAYAYAFGESILLPPKGEDGQGTRPVRIDRPLDFAAVTDHAEFFGETQLCADPASEGYASETCQEIRNSTAPIDSPLAFKIMHPFPSREADVCGEDGQVCQQASTLGWQEVIAAAEEWNDTSSACARTAFIAYEYSSFRLGSNLHRNVVFRNRIVPANPISFIDRPREWDLWKLLRDQCQESGTGCDVLAIPHNSNISNGRMFSVDYAGTSSEQEEVARAELRMAVEPIIEIMQHKGDSECRNGISSILGGNDELCDFEKYENFALGEDPGGCYDGPLQDMIPHLGPNCVSHRSYVRYALSEGLREEARIGVNPFKFGISASTDTHNAMAGGVEERSFPGHLGIADSDPENRLNWEKGAMGTANGGPGGLIGVWAEENSRDSIFDAMERKEVFGTSGPRIRPRFFASWTTPEDLCDDPDRLAIADANGVPMGGDLPDRAGASAPSFVTWATRDPGTDSAPGGYLQRLQIIKGWVDADDQMHQAVIDVAGGDNGASVDPTTCEPRGEGASQLCAVWRDPDFNPDLRAVYYVRAVENPSCRFSAWQCRALPEDERPEGCANPLAADIQRERAWTSPIWYTP